MSRRRPGSRFHQSLRGPRWERVRRRVLDAAGWRCRECDKYGNEVDHVQALHLGGAAWDLDNLQVLCRRCHKAKTRRESQTRQLTREEREWAEAVREIARG